MQERSSNPKHPEFHNYGGRGIEVCREWESDFPAFLAHIGPRISSAQSIDRIDTNEGYKPGNVKWSTQLQQMQNVRKNRMITFGGKTLCLSEWCRRLGIPTSTMKRRLDLGWPTELGLRRNK